MYLKNIDSCPTAPYISPIIIQENIRTFLDFYTLLVSFNLYNPGGRKSGSHVWKKTIGQIIYFFGGRSPLRPRKSSFYMCLDSIQIERSRKINQESICNEVNDWAPYYVVLLENLNSDFFSYSDHITIFFISPSFSGNGRQI